MGNSPFRDWIPAGEDPGAQGNVFNDFVPPAEPQKKEEVAPPAAPAVLKCEACGFIAKTEFGLKAHQRKHQAA